MQPNNIKQIEELEEGKWVTLEVTFQQEWESNVESIRQIGLLTDDTGIIRFVSWEKSDLPKMEEGGRYRIGKVTVTAYDGLLQVALVSTTNITRLDPTHAELPTGEEAKIPMV